MKVLLVDDDVFLCDMYATKFTESGWEVTSIMKPQEALTHVQTETYDALLTDLVMPGLGGIDLIKAIKKDYPDAVGKFIVLSNQSEPEDREAATAAGADGYIVKAEALPSEVVDQVKSIVAKT